MNWMKSRRILALMAMVSMAVAPSASQATLLYRQVFNPPAAGQSGAILPWSINMIGGYMGTYSGSFDPAGLRDAATNAPIGGNDGTAANPGTALYTGIGGPVTNNLRALYAVDGQAGFSAIDPATCPDGCWFNVWANTQQGGADDFGYFIIEGQSGGNRGPKQWYVSSTPMAAPTQNQGPLFDLRKLLYNPAAGNWNLLTLDTTNTVAPTITLSGAALPAGTKIIGVGILQSDTNPAPNADFSNDAFSSWNYADYRVTCGMIPEPASIVMLACGGLALLWFRRAK